MNAKLERLAFVLLLSVGMGCGGQTSTVSTDAPSSARSAGSELPRSARHKPEASALVREAEQLLAQGDAGSARAKLERALANDPHDARALLALGLAHEALGDRARAEKAYRDALVEDESLAEAHNNLALMLRDEGRLDDAIAELEAALARDPTLASAQANLALSYEDAGRPADARAAYEKAARLSRDDPMLHANFGLFLLGEGERERALGELRTALAKVRGERAVLLAVGNGLRRAQASDEAVRALEAAIRAGDGKPTPALLSELALAQHAANDAKAAQASLEQALTLDPNYATAHYLLASILAGEGEKRAAIEHYNKCIALDPKGPLAARAKEKLGALRSPR